MSEKNLSVFCQVGFPEKGNPESVYFHTVDGRNYGGRIDMEGEDELLDPYTIEDLLSGNIDYDLLPRELQDMIGMVAKKTYDDIERMDPERIGALDPASIEVTFQLMEDGEDGVEDEGKGRVMN